MKNAENVQSHGFDGSSSSESESCTGAELELSWVVEEEHWAQDAECFENSVPAIELLNGKTI